MKKKIVLKCFSITVAILLLTGCLCVRAETGGTPGIAPAAVVPPSVETEPQVGIGLDDQESYYIMNAATGSLLAPRSLSDTAGVEVVLRTSRAEQLKFQWTVSNPQSLSATITYANSSSGKVLTATTSGVTLNTNNNLTSQRFSIQRVPTGTYQGLYLIKSGNYYLSKPANSSVACMVSVPDQYSYWSIMEADKEYADLFSFTYPEADGGVFDTSANDTSFVALMDALGYVGMSYNNEDPGVAYDYLQYDEHVFVFRGHGGPGKLVFYGETGGISGRIVAHPNVASSSIHKYISDLEVNSLSKLRCALLVGCSTGVSSGDYNLVNAFFDKGAGVVLGTKMTVHTPYSNKFLLGFMQTVAEGKNIEESIEYGVYLVGPRSEYADNDYEYPITYVGDAKQYLSFTSVDVDFETEGISDD